jgi:hypothetical protein
MAVTKDTEHPNSRALVRALMRGDAQAGKIGIRGDRATLQACRAHGIDNPGVALGLLAYAYGYALGLSHDKRPDTRQLCDEHGDVVVTGWVAGCTEDLSTTFPAPVDAMPARLRSTEAPR